MPDPTRRSVVCGLLAGLVAPASLAACSSTTGTQPTGTQPTGTQPTGPAAPGDSAGGGAGSGAGGGALAKLSDVPVGGGKIVDGGPGKVLLVRTSENEVRGFDPVCPHAGVTVSAPKGGTITCPGHGSVFDASSGAMKKGPATTGLTAVAVKIDGDSIVPA